MNAIFKFAITAVIVIPASMLIGNGAGKFHAYKQKGMSIDECDQLKDRASRILKNPSNQHLKDLYNGIMNNKEDI